MAWVNLINGALADAWHVPLLFLVPAMAYLTFVATLYLVHEPLRSIFRDGKLAVEVKPELVPA